MSGRTSPSWFNAVFEPSLRYPGRLAQACADRSASRLLAVKGILARKVLAARAALGGAHIRRINRSGGLETAKNPRLGAEAN